MLDRSVPVLRVACLVLAGLVVLQLAWLTLRPDPLTGLRIPAAVLAAEKAEPAQTNAPAVGQTNPPTAGQTNAAAAAPKPGTVSRPGPGGMPGPRGPGMPPGGAMADVPPEVQNRIDNIVQSEVLGPVMRPPPMALLGIAGKDVFFRAPNGQTGLLREGEELGGVKLLEVGTNRILIEQDGKKQELMIFSGMGSETLMPKGKDTPQ